MTGAQERVLRAIESAWSTATSTKWRPNAPAAGQCSVTALLLHEMLGGRILKTRIDGAWHYYNEIDGMRLDLTQPQFTAPIRYDDEETDRMDAMSDTSDAQLAALRAGAMAALGR